MKKFAKVALGALMVAGAATATTAAKTRPAEARVSAGIGLGSPGYVGPAYPAYSGYGPAYYDPYYGPYPYYYGGPYWHGYYGRGWGGGWHGGGFRGGFHGGGGLPRWRTRGV